jgi:Viral BACON domain
LAQSTVLLMHSRPGDYIGAGGNWIHTPADGSFMAERNFDNGVEIRFENFPNVWWRLNFAAPGDVPLVPGSYELATRYPFQASSEPGLDVSGTGRGCNTLTGRFTVLEVVYGAGTAITSFAANFEQHCEGGPHGLFGSVRYNAAARAPYTVTAAVAGSGAGTITSFPAGIDCGVTCATTVADGFITALVATPAAGSGFGGWSGPADCADGVVSAAANVACTATFVACSYAISPTSLVGSPFGGFGQLNVTATPGCSWTPASSDSWLPVDTTTRTGSQPLGYSYTPRGPYSSTRAATITIGNATFTVTQPGLTPELTVYPTTVQSGPGAGTVLIQVSANVVDVPWTATSNDSWLGVPAGGLGSAALPVTVGANPLGAPRSGTMVIAGSVVTVQQQPNGPPGLPASFSAAVDGHVGRFAWDPVPFGNADSFRLEAGLAPGETLVVIPMPAVPGDFQLPGVPAGRFFVRLRGVNEFGAGPTTEDVELVVGANGQSVPAAPRNFITTLANGVLDARWQPSMVPGEVVAGYLLEAGTAGARTDITLPMGLAESTTIGNVPAGAYVLRVRAVNAAGAGAPTLEQLVVSGDGPAPPGPPGGLAAQVNGSTVTLHWNSPASGGTAAWYRLEVGPYRGATTLTFDTTLAATTVGSSGVPPGRYYVRIRGVNAQGLGPASADIRVDVP